MKYLSVLICFLLVTPFFASAQGDAISKYFDQYVEDERFTMVYISPKMFNLISKLDLEDIEDEEAAVIMDVVGDLKGLRVLSTDIGADRYYDEAIDKISTKEYDLLMAVRDKGENVRFWIKDSGNVINELLLLVGGKEFTMVSFIGNIDLNKISRLSRVIDIEGAEHLEKLGENKKNSKDD